MNAGGPSPQHPAVGGGGEAVADQHEEHRGRIAPAASAHAAIPACPECRISDSGFGESSSDTTRWKEVQMCLSCGCGEPNADHGDSRHITMEVLQKAAENIKATMAKAP